MTARTADRCIRVVLGVVALVVAGLTLAAAGGLPWYSAAMLLATSGGVLVDVARNREG